MYILNEGTCRILLKLVQVLLTITIIIESFRIITLVNVLRIIITIINHKVKLKTFKINLRTFRIKVNLRFRKMINLVWLTNSLSQSKVKLLKSKKMKFKKVKVKNKTLFMTRNNNLQKVTKLTRTKSTLNFNLV